MDGWLHATHNGGCGFCSGLGTTLRGGILSHGPSQPANGSSTIMRGHGIEVVGPLRALRVPVDPESLELGHRRRLAGAEVDPSVRQQVERGDPLGDARRVVDLDRQLHDAVAEPDALGALAARGEEELG